jgi:hypothetical protein
MMTQRLSEGIQHKLLLKLLEFDYSIEYKKGKENTMVGALSQQYHSIAALSTVTLLWIADIENSYTNDEGYVDIIQQLLAVTPRVSNLYDYVNHMFKRP